MKYRIWLDDIRTMPNNFDIWCKTGEEALKYIDSNSVSFISFDHDLGENSITGYDVAKRIEELAVNNLIDKLEWQVHSANPVGAKNIELAMISTERFWSYNESN